MRQVHKVDGPYEGKISDKSTEWTDPFRGSRISVLNKDGPSKG